MSISVFEKAKFIYPWRKYQQKVLDEIDKHLADDHLHVVAPPGSGKTVLGLEIVCRIGQPVLILAPTLAIRDQWQHRFEELFLANSEIDDLFSNQLDDPKTLTLVTYQALHAALTANADALIKALKRANIAILVVDEAHHLTRSWWHSLNQVKSALNPKIVGLTATPPYDVSWDEWQRYEALNGDVDAEIAVPELIAEGDLCPHQDYVFLSFPHEIELQALKKRQQIKEKTYREMIDDDVLLSILDKHPFFNQPRVDQLRIFEEMEFFSVLLIYLNHHEVEILPEHLEVIGNKKAKIPKLTESHLEILINYFLSSKDPYFMDFAEEKENWRNKLKHRGFMSGNTFRWSRKASQEKQFNRSLNKAKSVDAIIEFESRQLGNALRMVILTDYIRGEIIDHPQDYKMDEIKLGAAPLFELTRRQYKAQLNVALLTGSLVVVPKSLLSDNELTFSFTPYPIDDDFVIAKHSDGSGPAVKWLTECFQQGSVQLLVGTHALLGEGWDAPVINALILASYVGAHVTTNQMRGRAMRAERGNPDKTANIWHLATVDPFSDDGGAELQALQRRFKTFVGASYSKDSCIQSGLARVGLNEISISKLIEGNKLHQFNQRTFNEARQRKAMADRWHQAIQGGDELVEQLIKSYPEPGAYREHKRMYFSKTLGLFLLEFMGALAEFFWDFLDDLFETLIDYDTPDDLSDLMQFTLLGFMISVAPKLIQYAYLSLRYRDISKDLSPIASALLDTLIQQKRIRTPMQQLHIIHEVDDWGACTLYLKGSTRSENNVFLSSLEEMLQPIQNPRYIITREHKLIRWYTQKDYHAVPSELGQKKRSAERLYQSWQNLVGKGQLIFTRNQEGRKRLIAARYQALSARFQENIERQDVWR